MDYESSRDYRQKLDADWESCGTFRGYVLHYRVRELGLGVGERELGV